jgi:hypothetical protein
MWTWYETKPQVWCPIVWKDGNHRWNVTFYTLNEKDADLVFHNDIFLKGYEFDTFLAIVADYPKGYVV